MNLTELFYLRISSRDYNVVLGPGLQPLRLNSADPTVIGAGLIQSSSAMHLGIYQHQFIVIRTPFWFNKAHDKDGDSGRPHRTFGFLWRSTGQ